MRVLVVEDHADLMEILLEGLRAEGIAVDTAPDGAGALEQLAVTDYDVTCPTSPAMRCAACWSPGRQRRGC